MASPLRLLRSYCGGSDPRFGEMAMMSSSARFTTTFFIDTTAAPALGLKIRIWRNVIKLAFGPHPSVYLFRLYIFSATKSKTILYFFYCIGYDQSINKQLLINTIPEGCQCTRSDQPT